MVSAQTSSPFAGAPFLFGAALMACGLGVALTIPASAGGNAGALDSQLSWRRLNTFRRLVVTTEDGEGGEGGGGLGETDELGSGLLAGQHPKPAGVGAAAAGGGGGSFKGGGVGERGEGGAPSFEEEGLETKGLLEGLSEGAHHRRGSGPRS